MAQFVDRKTLAERIGLSTRRVGQLVEEGKISPPTAAGFDLAKALGEYQLNTDPGKRHAAQVAKGEIRPALVPPLRAVPKTPAPAPVDDTDDDEQNSDLFDYQESRAKRERHNANLAELKELQARGDLLRRDIVIAREFEIARKLRDRILGFPARLANFVPSEAMATITSECEALVAELQEEAARIAETSAQD